MPEPITFQLPDADGEPHLYACSPHPPTEGSEIMWRLVALGAEPLGRAAKGILAALSGGGLRALLDDPRGLEAISEAVDFGALGADVRTAILSMPMTELVGRILAHTTRDGKRLDNRLIFDAAYAANYGELLGAAWEVAKINRFLSLPATRSTGK